MKEEEEEEEKQEVCLETEETILDDVFETCSTTETEYNIIAGLIGENEDVIRQQKEKIDALERKVRDANDEAMEWRIKSEREEENHLRLQNQMTAEIISRDREISTLEKESLSSQKRLKDYPELKKTLDFTITSKREVEETNTSLRQENQNLMQQHEKNLLELKQKDVQHSKIKEEMGEKHKTEMEEAKKTNELLSQQIEHLKQENARLVSLKLLFKQSQETRTRESGRRNPEGRQGGSILAIDNPDDDVTMDDPPRYPPREGRQDQDGQVLQIDPFKYIKSIQWPHTESPFFNNMVASQIKSAKKLGCPEELLAQSLHTHLVRDPKVATIYGDRIQSQNIDISSLGQIVGVLQHLDPYAKSLNPDDRFRLNRPKTKDLEMAIPYSMRLKAAAMELFPNEADAQRLLD